MSIHVRARRWEQHALIIGNERAEITDWIKPLGSAKDRWHIQAALWQPTAPQPLVCQWGVSLQTAWLTGLSGWRRINSGSQYVAR